MLFPLIHFDTVSDTLSTSFSHHRPLFYKPSTTFTHTLVLIFTHLVEYILQPIYLQPIYLQPIYLSAPATGMSPEDARKEYCKQLQRGKITIHQPPTYVITIINNLITYNTSY